MPKVDLFSPGTARKVAFLIRSVWLFIALHCICLNAQTAADKGTTNATTTATGFSIETEMLTYNALESNSEAIACDITAYLNHTTARFTTPPPGEVCDVNAGSHTANVIVLPFDKTLITDFQVWRADMATMARLQNKASAFNCSTGPRKSAASTLLASTPAGPPLAIAQGVLGILSSEETNTSVGGNIQDLALMNAVARQLLSFKVPVTIPTSFSPYALAPIAESDSPYLSNLGRTLSAEACLSTLLGSGGADVDTDGIQSAIDEIDNFRSSLGDPAAHSSKGANTKNPVSSQTSSDTHAASTDTASTTKDTASNTKKPVQPNSHAGSNTSDQSTSGGIGAQPSASAAAHLSAVLLADGLAQALGVNPATGQIENMETQHILLLKALESGGSVQKVSNILGTRIRYSGGSVATYSLFTMDGSLECSGNVFDFGGSLKSKDFHTKLHDYRPDPASQMVFLRGGCRPDVQTK